MTTATLPPTAPLVDRWHHQVGRRIRLDLPLPRPFAALDLVARGGGRLVSVERLSFVLLHDAVDGGGHRLRFAAYGARRIPWGIALGGIETHRFEKDLALEPLVWARGDRIDAGDRRLLRTALRLDRRVERHARSRVPVPIDRPTLPSFWAAFRPEDAKRIVCDGPELLGLVHDTGRGVDELVALHRRLSEASVLLPLAWASHVVEFATGVYADLQDVPRRQLFRIDDPSESLVGFRGACQYDFLCSRFA
jgi:hypothetical protein